MIWGRGWGLLLDYPRRNGGQVWNSRNDYDCSSDRRPTRVLLYPRPSSPKPIPLSHMQELLLDRVFLFSLFPHPLPLSTCFILHRKGKVTYFSLLPPCFVSRCQLRYYRTQDLAEDICVRAVFLSLSLLPCFLSLSTKEDHAQHKRQQAPLLILCVRSGPV